MSVHPVVCHTTVLCQSW